MPTLSIIIPVYNAEAYLDECLHSILTQSFPDYELILIDDGSNDNSGKICDKYANLNNSIRVLHLRNGGASAARNRGLDIASGKYVWFIDADDWIDKDFLNSLNWDMMPDILFFGYKNISKTSRETCQIQSYDITYRENFGDVIDSLFTHRNQYFGFSWNKIFRRSIIENHNIRFRENLIIKEDEVFTLEYCKHISNISILSATPYNYRILQDSVSHSPRKKRNMYELATFLDKEIKDYRYPHQLSQSFTKAIAYYYREAIKEKYKDPELGKVIRNYISFIKRNKDSIKLSIKNKCFLLIPSIPMKRLVLRYIFKNET